MSDLKKKAEALGIDVDGRWSEDRIQQEIDKATAAASKQSQADQQAADEAKKAADKKAQEDAEKAANTAVSNADIQAANKDSLPTLGGPRVASSQEIREEKAADQTGAAPYPANPREAHARAATLSQSRGPAPEFRTSDIEKGEKGEDLYKIRLLNDWWDGQGLRHKRGELIEVPYNEAKRLVGERKAERADAFFGEER